jgi:hypothetical protein
VKPRFLLPALLATVLLLSCRNDNAPRPPPTEPPPAAGAVAPAGVATQVGGCNPAGVPPGLRVNNLVANPSFEEGAPLMSGWRRLGLVQGELPPLRDVINARSGWCSARLDRRPNASCGPICGYWSAPINVETGGTYRYILAFKVSPGLVHQSGVYVTVRVADERGSYVAWKGQAAWAWQADWMIVQSEALRIEPGVRSVVLDIAWIDPVTENAAEGQVWIDDVYFGP